MTAISLLKAGECACECAGFVDASLVVVALKLGLCFPSVFRNSMRLRHATSEHVVKSSQGVVDTHLNVSLDETRHFESICVFGNLILRIFISLE